METKAKRVSCFPLSLLAESRPRDPRLNRARSQFSKWVLVPVGSEIIAQFIAKSYFLFDVNEKRTIDSWSYLRD